MSKKITYFLTILIVALILLSLSKQISVALNSGKRLDQAADEVTLLQEQNNLLKKKLTQAKSYDNIEQILRDKLNLAKPDETVVIIPQSDLQKAIAKENNQTLTPPPLPYFQGWLKLFTH